MEPVAAVGDVPVRRGAHDDDREHAAADDPAA
jgi:hypothetical protein